MTRGQGDIEKLSKLAHLEGADLFGVADLVPAHKYIIQQGGEFLSRFSHAVVIGIKLSNIVVDQLDPIMPADYSLYGFHVYKAVSPLLDTIALRLSQEIERAGFNSLPIPTSQFRSPGKRISLFSHKLAAHLSGLGWIGKNCLLITPEYGPRVRLATVLTDCELASGLPIAGKCGSCRVCVDACPVSAITGMEFCESEGIERRLDVDKCGKYRDGIDSGTRRGAHVCALCLARCPKGLPQNLGLGKR
jgi:epoxyqueuosine reductase